MLLNVLHVVQLPLFAADAVAGVGWHYDAVPWVLDLVDMSEGVDVGIRLIANEGYGRVVEHALQGAAVDALVEVVPYLESDAILV